MKALALGMHFQRLVNMLQWMKKFIKICHTFLLKLHKGICKNVSPI
jgi:hypothetical protein